ncbi:MAG: DUF4007 family protein [Bacteroidota bacterium]
MANYVFSGHDKFHCRQYWLKKGYDFVKSGKWFSDNDAVVELGVGKNMVGAIYHWMKAFGLITSDRELTELSDFLLDEENGADPYLENIASIWLLHYHLIASNYASLYHIIFNEIKGDRVTFNEDHIFKKIESHLKTSPKNFSIQTIINDIDVFRRNYIRPTKVSQVEDDLSSILIDLHIIDEIPVSKMESRKYKIENASRPAIPKELILYGILNQLRDNQLISFEEIANGELGVGRIFALTPNSLVDKIKELEHETGEIVYASDGGIQTISLQDVSLRDKKLEVLQPIYR